MKIILVNAGNLWVGGGVQSAVSFINYACKIKNVKWFFVVSEIVSNNLDENILREGSFSVISKNDCLEKKINLEIDNFNPDLVYSVFGPLYFSIKPLHIMGFANGWFTHSTLLTFINVYKKKPLLLIKSLLKQFHTRLYVKKANYWICETEVAKNGLSKRASISRDKIFVIPNNCSQLYFDTESVKIDPVNEELKILVFCADHSNKNLNILPDVAVEIKKKQPSLKFSFTTTLDTDNYSDSLLYRKISKCDVSVNFENIGYVKVIDGPHLYDNHNVVFLPTFLETFSAVYPESIVRNVPLVTSKYKFSEDICGDASYYINPKSPQDCAVKILQAYNNPLELEDERSKKRSYFKKSDKMSLLVDLLIDL